MAQWAKAPSVETLVAPGSNPCRAKKLLFALFLSLSLQNLPSSTNPEIVRCDMISRYVQKESTIKDLLLFFLQNATEKDLQIMLLLLWAGVQKTAFHTG